MSLGVRMIEHMFVDTEKRPSINRAASAGKLQSCCLAMGRAQRQLTFTAHQSEAMTKLHEIRDPIHNFIKLDTDERRLLDSEPLQRLRHVHQLATSFLVYPGATHKRFEHSLGVMELAGRVFDVVTNPDVVHHEIRELVPQVTDEDAKRYWRRVVRVAALCHDVGHLPFSHATEDILPDGTTHEDISRSLIESEPIREILLSSTVRLMPEDVVKLALGKEKAPNLEYNTWEALLAEIIVGDSFGVDRIDYLLRDSHHAGVAYGRFDHYRLIDSLRILPPPPEGEEGSREPQLGVEAGGIYTAEALLLARYFMFTQVYFHSVRLIYDLHLIDFLKSWLADGRFSTQPEEHLRLNDNDVLVAIRNSAKEPDSPGHDAALRIQNRTHYRVTYERNPLDVARNPDAASHIHSALASKFGEASVKYSGPQKTSGSTLFPVLFDDEVVSSTSMSEVLSDLPVIKAEYVFIDPEMLDESRRWLREAKKDLIPEVTEEEDEV